MKRDVCAHGLYESVPAGRYGSVVWFDSTSSPRAAGAASYANDSDRTNASPRPHPRAYASTPRLSRSSPAIPPLIRFFSSGIN